MWLSITVVIRNYGAATDFSLSCSRCRGWLTPTPSYPPLTPTPASSKLRDSSARPVFVLDQVRVTGYGNVVCITGARTNEGMRVQRTGEERGRRDEGVEWGRGRKESWLRKISLPTFRDGGFAPLEALINTAISDTSLGTTNILSLTPPPPPPASFPLDPHLPPLRPPPRRVVVTPRASSLSIRVTNRRRDRRHRHREPSLSGSSSALVLVTSPGRGHANRRRPLRSLTVT